MPQPDSKAPTRHTQRNTSRHMPRHTARSTPRHTPRHTPSHTPGHTPRHTLKRTLKSTPRYTPRQEACLQTHPRHTPKAQHQGHNTKSVLTMWSIFRSNRLERGTPSKGADCWACPGPARYARQTGDHSHSASHKHIILYSILYL